MIGMTLADVLACMGTPDSKMKTTAGTAIVQWNEKTSDTPLELSALGFGFKLGGSGECKAVATVLRDGTVADMAFPGTHNANFLSPPSAACEPLVEECLSHPSATQLPPGFDAWAILFEAKP